MNNLKYWQNFYPVNEEEIASPLLQGGSMYILDTSNIMEIQLVDRYHLLSIMQKALNVNIAGYLTYYRDHCIKDPTAKATEQLDQ